MRVSAINTTTPYLYGHIASGNRLMTAADGAAELAITEKEQAQITGYNTGTKNLSDGISLLNTSDSALGSVTGYLQRIRELALQASNTATMSDSNRMEIQKEINQLKQGIEKVSTQTNFNGIKLLDGSVSSGVQLVSDADGGSVSINSATNSTLEALGIADFDVTKNFDLQAIDNALDKVNSSRSSMGAQSNGLEHTIGYNEYASINLTASKSRMADTDVAKALTELKHQQTLQSISMMLQKQKMSHQNQKTSGLLMFN